MAKQRKWVHVGGWLVLYLFWIIVFQKRAFTFSRTLTVQFCYLLFIAGNFYFAIYLAIPKLLYRGKTVLFCCAMIGSLALAALLRVPLAMALNRYYFLVGKPQPGFVDIFLNSALNISIWVVFGVACKLMMDRFRFQQYVGRVEQERLKAELAFLNAQFNPHFLFNSLNSIYGHIDKKNREAREMLLSFSDMLRYQLYECNTDLIGIDKELGYIRNYFALQQSRKEESLFTCLTIDEEVRGFSIAPLLFVAFLENAFKYAGNGGERENRIEIAFRMHGDDMVFTAFNTKESNRSNGMTHKGIGIANVRRRLELLYPGKYLLDIDEQAHSYSVTLKLYLK